MAVYKKNDFAKDDKVPEYGYSSHYRWITYINKLCFWAFPIAC